MSLSQKIVVGVGWQGAKVILMVILNLVYLMIMARLVSKEAFGVFAIANILLSFIINLTEFGFGGALIQKVSINYIHKSIVFYLSIFISIFMFFLLILGSTIITDFYDDKIDINVLFLILINLFFIAPQILPRALLIRYLKFKFLSQIEVISYSIGILTGIILAYLNYGVWALIMSVLVTNLVLASILLYYVRIPKKVKIRKKEFLEIFSYGGYLSILRLFNQLGNQLDKLLIGKYMEMNILGGFERVQRISQMPNEYMGSTFDNVLFATLAKIQNQSEKLKYVFLNFLRLVCIFSMFLSLACFIYSIQIISFLLGSDWIEFVVLMKIFAFFIYIKTFSRFADTLIRATNFLRVSIFIKIFYSLFILIAVIIGQKMGGIIEITIGVVIASLFQSLLMIILALHILKSKFKEILGVIFPSILIGAIFLIKYFLLRQLIGIESVHFIPILLITDVLTSIFLFYFKGLLIGRETMAFLLHAVKSLPMNDAIKGTLIKTLS